MTRAALHQFDYALLQGGPGNPAADVSFARSIGGLSAGEMDADQVFDVNMSNFNESKLSFGSSSTSRGGGTLSMGGAITGLHTNPTFLCFLGK